jgi:hypothetical protein
MKLSKNNKEKHRFDRALIKSGCFVLQINLGYGLILLAPK